MKSARMAVQHESSGKNGQLATRQLASQWMPKKWTPKSPSPASLSPVLATRQPIPLQIRKEDPVAYNHVPFSASYKVPVPVTNTLGLQMAAADPIQIRAEVQPQSQPQVHVQAEMPQIPLPQITPH